MAASHPRVSATGVVARGALEQIFTNLRSSGYTLVGPTVRDGAIVYDEIGSPSELPAGWTDEQNAGSYRLKRRDDDAHFGYTVGPHSWKKFLHPPWIRLWGADRAANGFKASADSGQAPKYALVGVRSCELHAMAIQDKALLEGSFADPVYKARREKTFILAVNCCQAGGTCFCASMQTGPKVSRGFDLALTEVLGGKEPYFLVEVGTKKGAEALRSVEFREAEEKEIEAGEKIVAKTAQQMGRTLDTTNIKELLYRNYEHARWDDVAARCLTCANCTMVCPTCFCTTVEDVTSLTGDHAERWRKWDSCFTTDFSYIHGGSIRATPRARYRQWMTHKLATWIDQFGTSGCVGCGRCITWCPASIDITEEVQAIRQSELVPTTATGRNDDGNP